MFKSSLNELVEDLNEFIEAIEDGKLTMGEVLENLILFSCELDETRQFVESEITDYINILAQNGIERDYDFDWE